MNDYDHAVKYHSDALVKLNQRAAALKAKTFEIPFNELNLTIEEMYELRTILISLSSHSDLLAKAIKSASRTEWNRPFWKKLFRI